VSRRFDQGSVLNPPAGTDFSFVPSTTDSFQLLALRAVLTIAAGGGGEVPHLRYLSQSGECFVECAPITTGTASGVVRYQWTMQSGSAATNGVESDGLIGMALPNWPVPANTKIEVATTDLNAGDQWSDIYYMAIVGEDREHVEWLKSIAGSVGNLDM
jgi:hypothetical protein